jgi:NAD(P)-dependent dehydrogenase (short-subunit alcohol dehydrogenase family)
MGRVAGKVALVTGAASRPGLGSATAERLAQEGARVVVTDRDGAGAEAVAAALREQGLVAHAHPHDVTSEADWERVLSAIAADQGRLDILVNNAGIAVLRPIDALTTADWARQIDVNLTSVYLGTRLSVRAMRAQGGGGAIVNLASVAGYIGVPACSAYAASKAGVRLFSRTIAMETAREGIRVNAVLPGMIWTNMQRVALADNPDEYDRIVAAIPMGRMGDAEDIGNMILFLASDEAKYITGQDFIVDGGLTAQ